MEKTIIMRVNEVTIINKAGKNVSMVIMARICRVTVYSCAPSALVVTVNAGKPGMAGSALPIWVVGVVGASWGALSCAWALAAQQSSITPNTRKLCNSETFKDIALKKNGFILNNESKSICRRCTTI